MLVTCNCDGTDKPYWTWICQVCVNVYFVDAFILWIYNISSVKS